ncbi:MULTISPECIES: ABC transporter permease [Clostridium]|uniref:ABC transporter permease n=1 Tax=Clostridium TaxID=1485 RepID=UPI0008271525|nr:MULTISPECIES: ABC transporter permease [Clostridium]PJI08120.1 ABC transporter permease [Clostridium sp. CT7]
MSIIFFGIKRMLNKKRSLIAIYILPAIFSLFFINIYISSSKIGVIDNDNTRLTQILKKGIENNYKMVYIQKKNIKSELQNEYVYSVISIDKGFTDVVLNNKEGVKLKIYGDKNSAIYNVFNEYVKAFITNSQKENLNSKGNTETFYKNMGNSIYGNEIYFSNNSSLNKMKILVMLRFLIMFMLLGSLTFVKDLMNDNTRTFAAPIDLKSYILQNSVVLFIFEMFQVILIFIETTVLCGGLIFKYLLPLLILFSAAIIMIINFSILIRYRFKYGLVSNAVVIIPMCMFGGCWWNMDSMPQIFQFISQFTPVKWVVDGIENILFNGEPKALFIDICMILLFSAAFLFIGTVNKKDLMN